VGPTRKVLGERPAERLDRALERPARGPVLAQDLDHQIANLVPVKVADAGVDALVTDDRQAALHDRDVDQDAVSIGRPVHAQTPEHLPRPREHVVAATEEPPGHTPLQMHSDLCRRARLGRPDRAGDHVEIGLAQEPPRPRGMSGHHPLPLAPPPPELPPPPDKPPPPPPPAPPARPPPAAHPPAVPAAGARRPPSATAGGVAPLMRHVPREADEGNPHAREKKQQIDLSRREPPSRLGLLRERLGR